jgi:hypothetical protein
MMENAEVCLMRPIIMIVLMFSLLLVVSACVPVDAPPEEVDWLSLNGSLITMDDTEKSGLLDLLSITQDGVRHFEIAMTLEGTMSAGYAHPDINDGMFKTVTDTEVSIEHHAIYDTDFRETPEFGHMIDASGVLLDPDGHILGNDASNSIDYIVKTYDDLENLFHHYNVLAFHDTLSISMSDRQTKEISQDDPDFPLRAMHDTWITDLVTYLETDLFQMPEMMDVYDVRYGHRYQFTMTPLDFLEERAEPVFGYTFDEETAVQMLIANLYVKDDALIAVRASFDVIPFRLETELEDSEFLGAVFDGPFIFEGSASISLVLNFHHGDVVGPDPDDLLEYRPVDTFFIPSLGRFLIDM